MIAAALALGLVLAAPVSAEDRDPSCTYEVKPRFRLAPVLKNGIPVRVTCAGPAETSSILMVVMRPRCRKKEGPASGSTRHRPLIFTA